MFPHLSLYIGDFNRQHVNWGYSTTSPNSKSLDSWATSNNLGLLYNPKETASFFSRCWNVGNNPDLAFASFGQDSRLPDRCVLGKLPKSQHRPSLITPPRSRFLPTAIRWSVGTFVRSIGSAFAFSQVSPSRDCHLQTHQILRGHTRIFARAYFLRLNNVSHMAIGRTMCHAGINSVRPSITPLSEPQWGLALTEPPRPYSLDYNRRSRSDGRKLSFPLTSRTPVTKHGEQSTNLLAGLDAPLACAPSQQIQSPRNTWRTGHTRPAAARPSGLSTNSCPTYGRFQHLKVTVSPNPLGRKSLLLPSDTSSQESLQDWIHLPWVYTPHRVGSQLLVLWLPQCMRQLKIPKIWRRALVVAIPKPEKPLGDPTGYRPISLLCVPFKILERLIYARVETITDPLLPQEQVGFRHGRSTADQVTLLMQDIKDSFSAKKKARDVFVDLTATYGTTASPACCCDCCLIDTWSTWSWRWLAIAALPYHWKWPKEQVTMPQERRPTGIYPGAPTVQHIHLQPGSHQLQKVCICWRPSNHACWWRLAGSGRGAEQGHGNARWISPGLEAKAQHHENGVSSLPSQQQGC